MPSIATSPISLGQSRVPVRTLAIEVVSGPGAGLRAEADSERMTLGSAAGNTVVLTDPTVSRFHLELARTEGGVEVTDLESTNGTFAGALRLSRAVVPPETQLTLGRSVLRVFDGAGTTVEVHQGDRVGDLLGASPSMRRLMAQVTRVAGVPVPVLLIGESGTGKELVARALHEHSPRKGGPLVVVDSGALAPCSGTSAGRSPAPIAPTSARSSGPTAARCSWTRSVSCRPSCSRSCSARSSAVNSGAWAGRPTSTWTCA